MIESTDLKTLIVVCFGVNELLVLFGLKKNNLYLHEIK